MSGVRRAIALVGALVALACAPVVAIADGLHAGNFGDAPAYAQAMRAALSFVLDAGPPLAVMRIAQALLASAALVALALARPPPAERLAWAAWGACALVAGGALLEALAEGTLAGIVGVGAYFVGLLPALLLLPLAGGRRLWRVRGRDRLGLALAAATPLAVVLTAILPQFPAPQIAAFALAWAWTAR